MQGTTALDDEEWVALLLADQPPPRPVAGIRASLRSSTSTSLSGSDPLADHEPGPSLAQPDVVFVGAGPVGLWAAVQVKLLDPRLEVVAVEKYAAYQRSHVLRVDSASFKGAVDHPRLAQLIESLPLPVVRTNDLEDRLTELAVSLGIVIDVPHHVVDIERDVRQRYPSARVIVGSDGSHSVVRQVVCDGKLNSHVALQHIVDVKYEVEGQGQKLNFVAQAYPTMKIMNHVVEEHVGRTNGQGRTPVTLRLLVTEETHARVKGASFKNPYYIPTHRELLGEKLVESITIWLNAKAALVGEQRVPGSEKISALKLSTYCSAEVNCVKDGVSYFLVGDAAFGVPFFRALNNGLLCGSHLAHTIVEVVSRGSADAPGLFSRLARTCDFTPRGYANFVKQLARREIAMANGKKAGLALAQLANKINGSVPWQVNKWSHHDVQRFKKTDPGFVLPAPDEDEEVEPQPDA